MAVSADMSCWSDPRDYSMRFFVGDRLGQIRLNYVDGSSQIFPLVLGESLWWGRLFYDYPQPFPTNSRLRGALATSLRLYPPRPVKDGDYVAVIEPKAVPLQSIVFENSQLKKSTPIINGITVETTDNAKIAGAISLSAGKSSADFEKFLHAKPLRQENIDEQDAQAQLTDLKRALYSSDEDYPANVKWQVPTGYAGPRVHFGGSVFAQILANAFSYNVQDVVDKIDHDGFYHTSTKGAVSWGPRGFGTFRANDGMYYGASWSRDLGRSLEELSELGYTDQPRACADYCLRMARLWEQNPALKLDGQSIPPHWSRVINKPQAFNSFENDGQGLITLFLYKLWQRLPDRDAWLRSRWTDIQSAGDWIEWQFDHPQISQASDGVLHTTGESAHGNGYSVYPDCLCMNALDELAQMADSIGKTDVARRWRHRAGEMRSAIAHRYMVTDPKYGRTWTLESAGWPNQSTVLGPLMLLADVNGFSPADDDPDWRPVSEATYQRLIDTYRPFGFYGPAMGYGQGFVTQSALLLDRMHDATQMLNWTAKEIYDPKFGSFIVPEGCQIDPTGEFWYRAGDLGNGVQEAEIIKVMRLIIGIDDTHPDRLRIFPRMPLGWNKISVEKFPALIENGDHRNIVWINYELDRTGNQMKLSITSDKPLESIAVRLGPFEKQPNATSVLANGNHPTTTVSHSGDSWWESFNMSIGATE